MSKEKEMSRESLKYAHCCKCGREIRISESSVSGICFMCLMSKLPVDDTLTKSKSDRPRGWTFMKMFVDKDGTVFEHGVENPELKGLYEPTDVEAIKNNYKKTKKSKAEKEKEKLEKEKELIGLYNEKKKEKTTTTEPVKVKKIKRK